jgi:hypothetical protein
VGRVIGAAALAAAAGCGSSGVSDTELVGTWVWESRTGGRSIIRIQKENESYRFFVDRYAPDGSHVLRCPMKGACALYEGDAPTYELAFRVFSRPGSESLFVECRGRPLSGGGTPIQYVSEITVESGRVELAVRRIELNGSPHREGERRYRKESDKTHW